MQKLLLVGLFWTAVLITLIIFNLNFYSNASAIEDGYMQEGNSFYNNYHENDGYLQEGNSFYNNYHENDDYMQAGNNDIGKLIVKVKIYLQNLERTGFLRISSLLNGEEVIKDIELSEIDRYQQTITVEDRKSTRLNSSHSQISYAVFCLKKKK